MRWLVVIVVIAIAAFFGYRYLSTENGQQLADQAGQAADQAAERVRETMEEVTGAVERATGGAIDSAEQAADSAGQEAERAADSTQESAESATQSATEATEQAADSAGQEVEQAADDAAGSAEQAVGEAADRAEQAADEAADTAQGAADSAEQATAALTVGGVNLGQEIGTTVSDATSALEGITDKASAEAALPSLEGAKTKLDELGGKVEQLPANAKESLASLLGDMLPEMQDLVNKVEGMEGVGEVVKPTLDSIMTTLDEWAKQPA